MAISFLQVCDGSEPCAWRSEPNDLAAYLMTCADGTSCSFFLAGLGCCDCHGGPSQCPSTDPNMCAGEQCGADVQFCCVHSPCTYPRACNATFVPPPPSSCANPPPPPAGSLPLPPPPFAAPTVAANRSVNVSDEARLQAAISDPSVARVVLAPEGSPYILQHELVVTRDLVLEAARGASGYVVLNASASAERPGRVLSVAEGVSVELRGLRLTGGWLPKGSSNGGAVLNHGTLHVVGCSIDGNTAYVAAGILNYARLEVSESSLQSNVATVFAGAVFGFPGSTMSVARSTISYYMPQSRGALHRWADST